MKKRIISAIIMAIIFIPLLIIGNLPFTICISILSMASIYELLKLKPNLPLIIKIFTYLETLIIVLFNTLKFPIGVELLYPVTIGDDKTKFPRS